MSIVIWLVIGALVGWLASSSLKITNVSWAVVLGIVGGFLGGWIMNAILGLRITETNVWSILVSIVVAFLFVWLTKAIKKAA